MAVIEKCATQGSGPATTPKNNEIIQIYVKLFKIIHFLFVSYDNCRVNDDSECSRFSLQRKYFHSTVFRCFSSLCRSLALYPDFYLSCFGTFFLQSSVCASQRNVCFIVFLVVAVAFINGISIAVAFVPTVAAYPQNIMYISQCSFPLFSLSTLLIFLLSGTFKVLSLHCWLNLTRRRKSQQSYRVHFISPHLKWTGESECSVYICGFFPVLFSD